MKRDTRFFFYGLVSFGQVQAESKSTAVITYVSVILVRVSAVDIDDTRDECGREV